MILAERTQLRPSPLLALLCHRAKNPYNLANWYVQQDFFSLGNVLTYYDLEFMTNRSDAYQALPAQTAQQVLRQVSAHNIGTLVIGYNAGWKQRCSLGRRVNQTFVDLPFQALVKQLQYKAELAGIPVILVPEAYTSKCSFLDGENIARHAQ